MNHTNAKRVFTPFPQWTTHFCQQTGAFGHLNTLFDFCHWTDFPSCEFLNNILPTDVKTLSHQSIDFIAQDEHFDFAGRAYETVIYQTGQVPSRVNSWHDTFGALMWCLFPKTKALLNQLHQQDIERFGQKERTKTRNAITLLDECGVILPYCDGSFVEQLRNHGWQQALFERREQWQQSIDAFNIGHANYEMLTQAYVGLTGKAMFVAVEKDFFQLPLAEQYVQLDKLLCDNIKQHQWLKDNSLLSPMPLLGIPGWWPDNEGVAFYQNKQYFREKRVPR